MMLSKMILSVTIIVEIQFAANWKLLLKCEQDLPFKAPYLTYKYVKNKINYENMGLSEPN